MSKKLIPIKLNKSQWHLVREAVSEWGTLCDNEADIIDGTRRKSLAKRAKQLDSITMNIMMQLSKSGNIE